jgi:SAM-dependent methyltransferase
VAAEQDRLRLRTTFDGIAGTYHQARPDYPEELFDALTRAARLGPESRLLEIGCGTGKATLPLARRGFRITCVELGPHLAAAARRNLADHDRVQVIEEPLENWRPGSDAERFDLIYAATAWHWVDPDRRCALAWRWLKPGGHLAIWAAEHVLPADGDQFFPEIQDVYDEIGEGLPAGWVFLRPGELADSTAELEASGLFAVTLSRQFDWEISYTAAEYIQLLDTFSSHIAMAQWQRDRLYGAIRARLAGRPDGRLRRHWGAALTVARRLDKARLQARFTGR